MIKYGKLREANILITGGTSGKGLSIVDDIILKNQGATNVYILSRNPSEFFRRRQDVVLFPNIFFITGDVETFRFPEVRIDFIIHTICKGTDHLIELAKRNPVQCFFHCHPMNFQIFPTEYIGE